MVDNQKSSAYVKVFLAYLESNKIVSIIDEKSLSDMFRVFSSLFEKLTEDESIEFTTLFSRIAFASIKYTLPGRLIYLSHHFRRKIEKGNYKDSEISNLHHLGIFLTHHIIHRVHGHSLPIGLVEPTIDTENLRSYKSGSYQRSVRGMVIHISEASDSMSFISEEIAHEKSIIKINDVVLQNHIHRIKKYIDLPIQVNLVDVQVSDGVYAPAAIVLNPDFLFGVTSVSECFQSVGHTSLKYLSRKLVSGDTSVHMLIGNVVNYYLDELINNPEVTFEELLPETFKISPIQFAGMSNDDLKDMLAKVRIHFDNLRRTVSVDLSQSNIQKEKSYLEPSFLSNEYGLQGRLDLYHYEAKNSQSDIVELKSGKLFRTNGYGLNNNHYIQTLLYDLIIESIYQGRVKSNNYILYSALDKQNLKYAPKARKQQLDAIKVRNEIVVIEYILCNLHDDNYSQFLNFLDPKKIDSSFSFLRRDVAPYYNALQGLSELELAYYCNFVGFVSREFHLSKTGEHGINKSNGLASLWLDTLEEKAESFRILSHLIISENKTDTSDPCIHLSYSDESARLSRFRPGDIVVFYPDDGTGNSVLRHQVFKSTIIAIDHETVVIRLRARQKNFEVFDANKYWHIEGDVLDGGFNKQLHGLYFFINAIKPIRNKILGLQAPRKPDTEVDYTNNILTSDQTDILIAAIMSPDYYLIWGPPGTGKTSVMIHSLVDYYYADTEYNILLLAYTNRAVDEICDAIIVPTEDNYVRIGSRYSTHPRFQDKLLSTHTRTINSRQGLRSLFSDHRVFVSTLSSFQGKKEISRLKQFDIVIIDEASQLLEPMLVGLLSKSAKYILIGDHKQLPAVVVQSDKKSYTDNALLNDQLSITDLRISYFERMYKQCQAQSWDWAIGALMHQGRMHQKILDYISPQFYDSQLQILSKIPRLTMEPQYSYDGDLQEIITQHRMLYIDTPIDDTLTHKTNEVEADIVIHIILLWSAIYSKSNKELTERSIGVITPFRAQIALIKEKLSPYPELEKLITVDTIERYQGGARDHIIFSMATNQSNALDSIVSMSEEGIDRKLNVALTRAKEHIIILGAQAIITNNPVYRSLIQYCNNVSFTSFLNHT